MTTKAKVIICVVTIATAFAFGRYTTPVKVKTEIKTVEVEKKTDDKESSANRHKKTVITVIQSPDGTKKTTTVITDDVNKKTDDKITDDVSKKTDQTKEVIRGSGKLTILALGGLDPNNLRTPVYGASVSKEILGPIAVGGWALTNKTFGIGIGLTF